MITERLLKAVKNEITRLKQIVDLLEGSSIPSRRKERGVLRPMSKEAREKIAAARRKRVAKPKKTE
jgi:hypothetical protein